jgi:TRAP-type transport system periplasmic protein
MKLRSFKIAIALFMVSGIVVVLGTAKAAMAMEPLTIRLGTPAPSGSSYHTALIEMGQKWRDASGGNIKLIIYADRTQGSEATMVKSMRGNILQAGALTVVGLSKIDDSVGGFSFVPLAYKSWEEYDYVVEKLSPRLDKLLLDKGFVVLFWGNAGWLRFFSKAPATHPDDFKKMKMFIIAGNAYQVDLMKALGYQPFPSETSEILTGFRTDLFNAIYMPPNQALLGQIYTVAKYMLDLKWTILSGALVIRKDAWDKIPPDIQKQVRTAAAEAGAKIRASDRREDAESITAMQKKGLMVQTVNPQVEEEWRKLMQTVYPKIRGEMVPTDIFDEVQRLVNEYRAKGTGK